MQVLAITCGLSDVADLAWWQPWRTPVTQRPWLPWAIAVQVWPLLLTLCAPVSTLQLLHTVCGQNVPLHVPGTCLNHALLPF